MTVKLRSAVTHTPLLSLTWAYHYANVNLQSCNKMALYDQCSGFFLKLKCLVKANRIYSPSPAFVLTAQVFPAATGTAQQGQSYLLSLD